MRMTCKVLAAILAMFTATPAMAMEKVAIGISDWTGFAPITLAQKADLYAKHGLDVTIRKIPQASRHLALQSGEIQCAATSAETWIVWNANGVVTTQLFQMDKSYGGDGMIARRGINSIKDIKGKTIAVSAPGTAPYFTLAWFLKKNGLGMKDVTLVEMEPGPAVQAFLAGKTDAAMSYEPHLSEVRTKPSAGQIIATTRHYPMVTDTFGCATSFIAEHESAVRGLTASYFDALALIRSNGAHAYRIMGAEVKQSSKAFGNSAKYLRWQDREANRRFFAGEFGRFSREAADLLIELSLIKSVPDLSKLADARFLQ